MSAFAPALTAAPVAAAQPAAGGSSVFMLLMFAALAVLMFLSFRRAKKVQTQQADMRRSLTPGQEVMLTAGIFGTVVSVDEAEQRATLEVAPGTRLQVHLQGIASVVDPAEAETADAATAVAVDAAPVRTEGAGSTAAPVVAPLEERPDVTRTDVDGYDADTTPRTDRA